MWSALRFCYTLLVILWKNRVDKLYWHVKFRSTWQQRNEKETDTTGWALLLNLCKLRHNFSQEDLAMHFGVNQSTVSRLYSCWTKILEACMNEFPLWPDETSIHESVPAAFKNPHILTHVSSSMLRRLRTTAPVTRYSVTDVVWLQASNFQALHH